MVPMELPAFPDFSPEPSTVLIEGILMGTPWLVVVIIGPIMLGLVLAWSMLRNRQQTRAGDEERSDQAARALRQQLDAEDKAREKHPTGGT